MGALNRTSFKSRSTTKNIPSPANKETYCRFQTRSFQQFSAKLLVWRPWFQINPPIIDLEMEASHRQKPQRCVLMNQRWKHLDVIDIYCSIYVCMFTSTEWFRCLNVFCILWFLDSRYLVEPAADFSVYIYTSDRLANGWLCLHIHIIFNICKIMYRWQRLSESLSWALFFQRSDRTSWRLAPVNSRPKSITSYTKARVISGQPSDPKGYLLYYITTKHKITYITREKKTKIYRLSQTVTFPFQVWRWRKF